MKHYLHYFIGKVRTAKQYLNFIAEKYKSDNIRKDYNQKSIYSHFITSGNLVFDVGANIGEKTKIFLDLGAKVVSVEPQQSCARLMRKRFKSELNRRLKVVDRGLSDREDILEFYICDASNTISTFSHKWQTGRFCDSVWNRKRKIQVTTLDHLIKEHGVPVFCKIDVEGYELNVLKGLSQPIKYISFEFTGEFIEDAIECIDYIGTLGKAKYSYGNLLKPLKPLKWLESEKLINILQNSDDDHLHGDIYACIS